MANRTSKATSDESEVSALDTRPCFYKIMWPTNLVDLRIPPAFNKHLINEKAGKATIRSSLGTWKIKLIEDENTNTYCLKKGWKKFVQHHSLGEMECLIFKYNGKMCFDVAIYDIDGCLKKYPSTLEDCTMTLHSPSSSISRLPSFEFTMKSYNIGHKCTLQIPLNFSRRHLRLSEPKSMILKNSQGICWSVNLIINYRTKQVMISKGWKAFSEANKLKIDDRCIFKLVDEKTMQVHVIKSIV